MNYELAKELKDAGLDVSKLPSSLGNTYIYRQLLSSPNYSDTIGEPTLSELIEACGEQFGSLVHQRHPMQIGTWYAQTSTSVDWDTAKGGVTPEEAVARLWLALNKKP